MRQYKKIILLLVITLRFSLANDNNSLVLNLDDFIGKVNEHSIGLKLVAKELNVAKANKKEAYSTALPKIFSQGGYTRNLNSFYMYLDMDMEGFPEKLKANYDNNFELNTRLEQTLFSPIVGNAIKAAKQYENMTKHIYNSGHLHIMIGAKKLFHQALLLNKVIEVNTNSEKNARKNFELTKTKFKAGTVSEMELYQAEVNWRNTIPELTLAEKNYQLALNNIKEMAGIDISQKINIVGNLEKYPVIPEIPELESVLKLRPDYKAMQWQSKLLKTNIRAKRSDYFPTLSGNITHSYTSASDDLKLERENNLMMVGLSLNIPIWTGGYTKAQVQKAKISFDKSRLEIKQSEDAIEKDLENIKLTLEEAEARIDAASTILKTAEKGHNIAITSAENGLATQLELKDARLLYNQAQLGYYGAVLDYLMAYFDYELIVGHTD